MFSLHRVLFYSVIIAVSVFILYNYSKSYRFENDYESKTDTISYLYSDDTVHSGKHAIIIDGVYKYGLGFKIKPSEIKNKRIKSVFFQFYGLSNTYQNQFYFVTHFQHDTIYYYNRSSVHFQNHIINKWQKYSGQFSFEKPYDWLENTDIIFYLYNAKSNRIFIDDLRVDLIVE
jgi:hypothetical protein